MLPSALNSRGAIPSESFWLQWIRKAAPVALDLLIAVYALALLVTVLTGGTEFGFVRLRNPEKSILVLLLAVPARLTIYGTARPFGLHDERMRRWMASVRTYAAERIPVAVVDVAFAILVMRALGIVVAFVANLIFAPHRERPFSLPFEHLKLAEVFAQWDSGWYFDIASRGYYFRPDGQSSLAFFPLYPMAMRMAAWPFGGTDRAIWGAGIAISWLAFILALLALHRLTVRITGDRQTARRAVLYLAIFPFSVFFTRVYAESVFLLTSVLALSRANDQRWWRAGLWGALATLARPNGILIGLPLAIMALEGRPSFGELTRRGVALVAIPLALAGYCLYAYGLSGRPLGWLEAQAAWGYSLGHPPWELLLGLIHSVLKYGPDDYFFVSTQAAFQLFHGVAALAFLALTPAVFRRFGVAMGAYVLASLLVPLSGNALEGIGRYASVLFPAFMVVGSLASPRLHEGLLIGGSLFWALVVSLLSTGSPIY